MTTLFYAGILGFIFLWMTTVVIRQRRKHKISYGVGPRQEIAGVVAAHSNFVAYVPLILLTTFIAEDREIIGALSVHGIGISLCLGRLLHFFALNQSDFIPYLKYRVWGMALTLIPLAYISLRALLSFFIHGAY